jgi:hypothetical protein
VAVTEQSRSVKVLAGIRFPLAVFAVWRVLHAVVVLVAGGSVRAVTVAFDGGWYLSVLRHGYQLPPGGYADFSNAAFFPGLSWLTQAVQLVVRSEAAATMLVANALALTAFVSVWGAVRAWAGDVMARRATLALALFPTSYFLWAYYTEALLITGSAAAAWAARRERHNTAALLLAVAASARLVGAAVGPALALARIVRMRRVDSVSVRYLLGSLVGLGAVMAQQAVQIGDPLGFMRAGQAWGRGFAGPWVAFSHAAERIVDELPGIAEGPIIDTFAVVVVGCLVLLLWQGARRGDWPLEPVAIAGLLWLVPICSRLTASQARYMVACWPALLAVAWVWPRLPHSARVAVVVVAATMGTVLLGSLARGVFTG